MASPKTTAVSLAEIETLALTVFRAQAVMRVMLLHLPGLSPQLNVTGQFRTACSGCLVMLPRFGQARSMGQQNQKSNMTYRR